MRLCVHGWLVLLRRCTSSLKAPTDSLRWSARQRHRAGGAVARSPTDAQETPTRFEAHIHLEGGGEAAVRICIWAARPRIDPGSWVPCRSSGLQRSNALKTQWIEVRLETVPVDENKQTTEQMWRIVSECDGLAGVNTTAFKSTLFV